MYKKQISKMMFSFMCLLIFLQYVTPIVALATETKEPVQLAQLKVTNRDPATLEAILDLQINSTEQSQTQTLTFNEGANIQNIQAVNSAEPTNVEYIANKNQIEMKVDPNAGQTLELKLTFAAKDLEAATELTVQTNQQNLNAELPTIESTKETSSSELVESSTTNTTDYTKKESDQTSEITSESSEITSNTVSSDGVQENQSAEKIPAKIKSTTKTRSSEPQDIRGLLTQAGIAPATLIDNAKIEYFDENGKLYPDQKNVPIDAHVHISYKWSIPEDILSQLKAGDYFDFKLPNGVTIQPGSGKLGDYGTYTIAEDGTVHFVFNQKVETDHDIKGTFDYDAKFDKTTEPGEITIDTPTEENFPPSTIHIRPKYDQAIDKAGHFDKTPNPDEVIWEININRPLNMMKNAMLTDPMPEGTTFKTAIVYPETVDREGKITSVDKEHPLVEGKDYTVNAAGTITFINSYAETNQAFQVVYTTKIDEDKKPDKGGSVKFTNKATLDDGTAKTDASATVAAEYKAPITKKGPTSTGQNQEYKWSIQYNYNEKKRPAGTTVTDTMSEALRLVDNSTQLYRITFDKNGKEVQGALLKAGEDYELIQDLSNPQKFTIKFLKDIDYAVRIDYLTKVTGYVDDPTKISNSVETDTDDHSSSGGTAEQQGIVKGFDGPIDYAKREIPWKIDINNAGYWMENWELEDIFSDGLTLVNGSFQLIDRSDNNRVLTSSEYIFTQTATGFKLSFKDPLAKGTDHKYQIKYKTVFDTSVIDPGNGHEGDIKFKNKASMTWKDKSGGNHSNSSDKPFDPLPAFKYNGQKSGEYNATTKKITWTVAVNYNQQKLQDSSIVDPISTPQNYVAGSGKLYEATINKDGSYILGEETSGKITEPTKDNPKIEVKLPTGSTKAYVFVFDTSLIGEIIDQKEYKNSATFTNEGISHNLDASVTPAHAGELVEKDGEQDSSDSSYVKWRVTVNGSQSTMKDVEVTDEPSANQYVAADDVKVYGTIVDKAGNIAKDPNTVLMEGTDYQLAIQTNNETGAQIITVKFLKQIETSYVIEYRALITSDKAQDEATNQAHIKGINEKTYTDDVEKNVAVINHSGTAEGSKGSVLFQKQNEAGEKLANAHLQLWTITKDGQKDKLVREGDTDAKGEIKLGNLRVADYLLIETKAPAGYTISDELAMGKKVTIKKDTETTTFAPQKIINQPTKVILHKSGETVNASGQRQKNPLAGAVFEVLDSKGKVISGYERLVSDKTGTVTIEKLAPGNYQIVEIKAPNDYILDNKVIEFEVKQQENGIIPMIDLGTKINYQGSAELIKKDDQGNALAGAEFKVIDEKSQTVQEKLVSTKDGVVEVENLAPGNYRFVETKAPAGYILNSTDVPFVIEAESRDKPTVVIASADFINYKGSAQLIKKDAQGNALAGAEFKVIDEQNKTIQEDLVSTKDGVVEVENLAPGNYRFIETKAPAGYILNSAAVPFVIEAESKDKPTVVLADADFINYQGSAQLIKKDAQGNVLAGAEFKVIDKQGDTIQKDLISNKKGVVKVHNLAPGKYRFVETQAPKGYILNNTSVPFVIETESKNKPTVVVASADFINYQGSAELIKKDAQGNALAGAEFKVIDKRGHIIQKDLISNEKGIVKIHNLAPGKYRFVETKAPKGYVLNSAATPFVIEAESKEQPTVVLADADFINYQGSAQLIKKDAQGNVLAGAEFKVIDKQGDTIQKDLISNKKGVVKVHNLAPGKYRFVETKAPKGYILNTKKVLFTIKTESKDKPAVVVASDNFVNYQGSAQLIKKDEKGNALAGAEFKVIDKQGDTIQKDLISNKKGVVKVHNLAPGKYRFVETKAPSGYILNTKKVSFTIEAETTDKPKTIVASDNFVNYQGSAQLIKQDEQGNHLAGALFRVDQLDAQGKVLKAGVQKNLISSKIGVVLATDLAPGNYQFVETEAPKGYQLSNEVKKFVIQSQAEDAPEIVESGKFINQLVPEKPKKPTNKPQSKHSNHSIKSVNSVINDAKETRKLPQTNDVKNYSMIILGILILATIVIVGYRRYKNK